MSPTADNTLTLHTESLTAIHWVGVVAAVISAVIHFRLGVGFAPDPLGISFLLAGVGFVVAIALILVGYRRRLVYLAGVPFVAVQVVAWYYLNFVAGPKSFPADIGVMGAIDKVAQLVLLVVIVVLLQRADR